MGWFESRYGLGGLGGSSRKCAGHDDEAVKPLHPVAPAPDDRTYPGTIGGLPWLAHAVERTAAGKGWIALALVVFSTWRPTRLLTGTWLFGGMTNLQLQGQAFGLRVPSELLSAVPQWATIVVLVIISRNRQLLMPNFPASLAKPFRPSA